MKRRDYFRRRDELARRRPRGGSDRGPYVDPPRRMPIVIEDHLDEHPELRYTTRSWTVRGVNAVNFINEVGTALYDLRLNSTTGDIYRAVGQQLAPGQTVVIALSGFDVWSGTFEEILIVRPGDSSVWSAATIRQPIRSTKGGLPLQETRTFVIPTAKGDVIVQLSGGEGRSGDISTGADRSGWNSGLRDYFNRWNDKPGTYDLDMDEYRIRQALA